MIPRELLSDYKKWKTDATGESLTLSQYLGSLLDAQGSLANVIVALVNLATPEICRRGECVLIQELLSEPYLKRLEAERTPPGEIEYWMNLFGNFGNI